MECNHEEAYQLRGATLRDKHYHHHRPINVRLSVQKPYNMNIKDYIKEEINKLDKGIVATPKDREYLESFAKANHGSMDLLLMQMAIQFGYKIALENVQDELK